MVYNNPVQQQVFDLYYQFNPNLKIYFIPAVYFSLLLWYISLKFVNRDQLILFLTFTFLLLTLMIAPMQGWYYWILPFLIYFTIKKGREERQLLALLCFFYFLYFAFAPSTDYHNSFIYQSEINSSPFLFFQQTKIPDIVFTLLQSTLLIMAFLVYKKGIHFNIQTKFLSQPYTIGIAGDSATGKSTLSNSIELIFEKNNTSIIRGDDMHKWERGDENWQNFTHLNPKANDLHQDMNHAISLKTGNKIKRRNYDHSTGKFKLPTFIKSNKLVVFEGLHSFYLKNQADIYDLKLFMDPEEKLRIWWKIKRDVVKRGYTPEKVLDQIKQREEDSLKYIRSQSENADIIIKFYSLNDFELHEENINPNLGLKLIFHNNINLEPLLAHLHKYEKLNIRHNYFSEKQELNIEGKIESSKLELIANKLISELEEVGIYNTEWKDDYEGLLQLFIVYLVFYKLID
jgi:uridine kinase